MCGGCREDVTTFVCQGLEPGTKYLFKSRVGANVHGTAAWGQYSVESSYVTTGSAAKHAAPAAAAAASPAAAAPVPGGTGKKGKKGGAKDADHQNAAPNGAQPQAAAAKGSNAGANASNSISSAAKVAAKGGDGGNKAAAASAATPQAESSKAAKAGPAKGAPIAAQQQQQQQAELEKERDRKAKATLADVAAKYAAEIEEAKKAATIPGGIAPPTGAAKAKKKNKRKEAKGGAKDIPGANAAPDSSISRVNVRGPPGGAPPAPTPGIPRQPPAQHHPGVAPPKGGAAPAPTPAPGGGGGDWDEMAMRNAIQVRLARCTAEQCGIKT